MGLLEREPINSAWSSTSALLRLDLGSNAFLSATRVNQTIKGHDPVEVPIRSVDTPPNILRDREYPDLNPSLPFRDAPPPQVQGPIKEANDEDHIPSGDATNQVIVCNRSDGAYKDQQKEISHPLQNL